MPDVMLNWSFNHLFSGEVGLSLAVLKVRELGRGSTPPGCTVARSRQEWSRASLPHPSPSALLQGVGTGAQEVSGLRSTGTPKPLALVATAGLPPPVGPFGAECDPPAPRLKLGGNPPG